MSNSGRFKIACIGAGNVGASAAQYCAEMELGDVVLTDVVDGLAEGKALDLMQAAAVRGCGVSLTGTMDYADIAGSDVCVVTAGLPRRPGMTRLDLLEKNGTIISEICGHIAKHAPDSIVVLVTNPLDVMAVVALDKLQFSPERVMGMAGCLDSARLCTFVAMELGVSVKCVEAMVLGAHGDNMVPLPRYTTVSGVPITELLSPERIEAIVDRTRNGGAEVVGLLKKGGAYYAPGACAARMVQSILRDEKQVLPCSARLTGQYGLNDLYIGVPVRLGRTGVEEVLELPLTDEQVAALHKSADEVRAGVEGLRERQIL